MPVDTAASRDPRSRLVREKYFCVRPRPLEQWLWSKRIPSSAERVFWLHWQEGMRRGDWCSELPIRRVARDCHLDTSTVTRAYQLLTRLGCLRRSDPGRDPANPFQQATAITEIRLPHELLQDLNRHPNRRAKSESPDPPSEQGRAHQRPTHEHIATTENPLMTSPFPGGNTPTPSTHGRAIPARGFESHPLSQAQTAEAAESLTDPDSSPPLSADPFPGLTGRERLRAIAQLTSPMSNPERHAYQEAIRLHIPRMPFDPDSKLTPEAQSKILQLLVSLAQPASSPASTPDTSPAATAPKKQIPRKLSLFELSRLRRELQSTTSITTAPELLRQVVWSVESGSLRRFDTRHALHIALKKIREGLWTRPNRMPPNWARSLLIPSAPEPCGHA